MENIVKKGGNGGYQVFLLFLQCFLPIFKNRFYQLDRIFETYDFSSVISLKKKKKKKNS